MRPIPAPRIGDSHGLLRALAHRERVRLDEFVTEFPPEELFPPDLENAAGRTRHFVSYARGLGLVKEDRGTVELTDLGKRYARAGDDERALTATGMSTRNDLTLPIHMSLTDIAAQLNPGGADAVRAEGEEEWDRLHAASEPEPSPAAEPEPSPPPAAAPAPAPEPAPDEEEEDEWQEVGPGARSTPSLPAEPPPPP